MDPTASTGASTQTTGAGGTLRCYASPRCLSFGFVGGRATLRRSSFALRVSFTVRSFFASWGNGQKNGHRWARRIASPVGFCRAVIVLAVWWMPKGLG